MRRCTYAEQKGAVRTRSGFLAGTLEQVHNQIHNYFVIFHGLRMACAYLVLFPTSMPWIRQGSRKAVFILVNWLINPVLAPNVDVGAVLLPGASREFNQSFFRSSTSCKNLMFDVRSFICLLLVGQ